MTFIAGYRKGNNEYVCDDINECVEGNKCLGGKSTCVNTVGSYK